LDLILGRSTHPDNSPDSTIAFLGGNGDGTFRAPILTHAGVQAGAIQIINANGDAFPDLAVFRNSDAAVLIGNGDGTFGTPIVTSTAPRYPVFADLDGDGIADRIEVGTDPVVVEYGVGDGTFANPITIPSSGADAATAGDLDGDGYVDLVLTNSGEPPIQVSVWPGAGGHTFLPGASYVLPSAQFLIGLADFDHDGHLDLAFESWSDALEVLPGNGDATFSALPAAFGLGMDVGSIEFADLDGDGKPEVLTAENSRPAISVLRNRSTGGSTAVPVTPEPLVTSLVRATPNPASANRLSVNFSLTGREAARLEVFDITGRRLRSLDVTRFGPGPHQADLAEGGCFAPGLYVLRLSQGGRAWTARAVVMR
jgi:hypothetical protein